ncbi:MAG: hypothetical protein R3F11_20455 [Verrucomicrobiales bacterium]
MRPALEDFADLAGEAREKGDADILERIVIAELPRSAGLRTRSGRQSLATTARHRGGLTNADVGIATDLSSPRCSPWRKTSTIQECRPARPASFIATLDCAKSIVMTSCAPGRSLRSSLPCSTLASFPTLPKKFALRCCGSRDGIADLEALLQYEESVSVPDIRQDVLDLQNARRPPAGRHRRRGDHRHGQLPAA